MTDVEVKIIKAELSQMAAKDKFSNICESVLRLINLYEAIILGNQMENTELKKENDCYKALKSHYEEIEEDAKAIAKENEELKIANEHQALVIKQKDALILKLKAQIEQMTDGKTLYKNGYEKCLEDVYAELDKIRKSEPDFYIREAAAIVRLKLRLEFTRK